MNIHLIVIFSLYIASSNASKCCDQLNSNTNSNDCTCSDQTGAVGTCSCTTSPNTRTGWLCTKTANGDSVNIRLKNK